MTFKTKSFLPLLLLLCFGVSGFGQTDQNLVTKTDTSALNGTEFSCNCHYPRDYDSFHKGDCNYSDFTENQSIPKIVIENANKYLIARIGEKLFKISSLDYRWSLIKHRDTISCGGATSYYLSYVIKFNSQAKYCIGISIGIKGDIDSVNADAEKLKAINTDTIITACEAIKFAEKAHAELVNIPYSEADFILRSDKNIFTWNLSFRKYKDANPKNGARFKFYSFCINANNGNVLSYRSGKGRIWSRL